MKNKTILPVGTQTKCMIVGKPLLVEITEVLGECPDCYLGAEYTVRYIGDAKVCLDFGSNWFTVNGDMFNVRQGNIDAVNRWVNGEPFTVDTAGKKNLTW